MTLYRPRFHLLFLQSKSYLADKKRVAASSNLHLNLAILQLTKFDLSGKVFPAECGIGNRHATCDVRKKTTMHTYIVDRLTSTSAEIAHGYQIQLLVRRLGDFCDLRGNDHDRVESRL